MGRTVTRVRRVESGVDRYGNPTYTTSEVEIPGALFSPERDSSDVIAVGRTTVSSKPTLYWFMEKPDIRPDDVLRVDGLEYEVDGIPSPWSDDLSGGPVGGLVVTLKRVTG